MTHHSAPTRGGMREVKVNQRDRLAAAKICTITEMRELIIAGLADDHLYVQEFAAHRMAALVDVDKACRAAQYSPAPHTELKYAVKAMMEDGV